MKKLVSILVTLAILSSFAFTKPSKAEDKPAWEWAKAYGGKKFENSRSILQTSDGGYLLGSHSKTWGGNEDIMLIKLNKGGNIQWAKTYDSGFNDYINRVERLSDGYIIVGGSFDGTRDRIFVIRTDLSGNVIWSKLFKYNNGTAWGDFISQEKSGNGFVIGGGVGSTNKPSLLLLKLDKMGEIKGAIASGYNNGYEMSMLYPSNNGAYIMTGSILENNTEDVYVLKLDSNLEVEWAESIGSSKDDWGSCVTQLNDNSYIIGGGTKSFSNGFHGIIVKLDSNGKLLWGKVINNGYNNYNYIDGLIRFSSGIGIFGSYSVSSYADSFAAKISSDGNLEIFKTFGGWNYDFFLGGSTTNDGTIFAGRTKSFGKGDYDSLVVKTNRNLEINGCKQLKTTYPTLESIKGKVRTKMIKAPSVKDVNLTAESINPKVTDISKDVGVTTICEPAPIKPTLISPLNEKTVAGEVTLKWEEVVNSDYCEIQLSDSSDFRNLLIDDKVIDKNSFILPHEILKEGSTYFWRVRGINKLHKGEWSEPFSFTVVQSPSAPALTKPVLTDSGFISISWSASKQGKYPIAGYAIYRGTESGKEDLSKPIATVDANTTQYTDKTVELNKTYYYVVKAFDNQTPPNYSSPSNEVKVEVKDTTPPTIPINSPENFTIVNEDTVTVSGTVTDDLSGVDTVTVNGNAVTVVNDGSFSTDVSLTKGDNTIQIVATDKSGNKTTKSVVVTYKPQIVITLQPDNPYMTVNGVSQEIDQGRGTKPVIIAKWGRTVVPIRAIVEALGGTIEWDGIERKVTINFNDTVIELWIDNPRAKVNGETKWIDENNHDVKPIIVNDRTMLPLRFVVEHLGCTVDWDAATKTITITYTP